MASKALANPFIRHLSRRGYAQAAPVAKSDSIQTSVLPNKTYVAALDSNSPVARVTIAFRAGSRYEPQTELGVSHILRAAAGLTTGRISNFLIGRKLAQAGASVNASGDREFVYYTLEATQDNLQEAVEILASMVSSQEFRPWELSDNVPRIKYELASLFPQARAVDLLHKAAFRTGLGNSLFISPKRVDKVSSESLQHYASNTLTPGRCVVAVVGDNQDRAALIANSLQFPSVDGNAPSAASKYYGGELRKEMGGDFAHVALALQGAAVGTPQSLALAVAAKALGNGPVTKWGADNSVLAKSIGNIGPFAAAGFNVSYSDSGLFGVVLTVPKDEAQSAVKSVASVLKKGLPSDAIRAGKNQLKLQILSEADAGTSLAESIAAQVLYSGAVRSAAELAAAVDKLDDNTVNQALSSAAGSKYSMGAAGNLAFVPYVDEL